MDLQRIEIIKKQIRQCQNMLKLNNKDIQTYINYSKSIWDYCNYLNDDINEVYNKEVFEEFEDYYSNEIKIIKNALETLMKSVIELKENYELSFNTGNIFAFLTKILKTDIYTENIIICYEKALKFNKNNSEIYKNLSIAYEKSITAGKDENKGKDYLQKMLRNYKKFIKSPKENNNSYMIYAKSLYSLFDYAENTDEKEEIVKYLINLYLTAKQLLPYELDVYTTGGIIFNSLILKYYSKKYIGKIDKYANEAFEKTEFLDGYTVTPDEDDEESLLSLNFDYAKSSYYDIEKERKRFICGFESLINAMKTYTVFTYINTNYVTDFEENELFEYAIELSGLKVLVLINQYVLKLESEDTSFTYKMSVLYLFGKVLYKLSKEEKYKNEAELLLLKSLEYFERTNDNLYPDIYIQISLVLLELSKLTSDELKKTKLLHQAKTIISKTKTQDELYETTLNMIN